VDLAPRPTRQISSVSATNPTALVVAYGNYETPEFERQNREFAAAVETAGKKVRRLVGETTTISSCLRPSAIDTVF
jgi:arylformamidase